MNGTSHERGVSAADLQFLEAHVRDTKLATGVDFEQLPSRLCALRDACLTARHVEDGRLRALAVAVDRGVERELVAVATQPAARGKGVGRRLVERLVKEHVDKGGERRALASVWPGLRDAAGLLMSCGFETSAGAVRFERDTSPLKTDAPEPPFRWVDAAREPEERRERMVAAAVAAYPGDADVGPTLRSLASAENGFVVVGFAGNDARVVAAGHEDDDALRLITLFASDVLKDHSAAERLMSRLVERGRQFGRRRIVIESARPVARTVFTAFRIGFRAVDAAAGFRLGPIPDRTPAHVFAV